MLDRWHTWIEYALLVAILAGYLVVAGLYAVQTPAWQAPDEPAHYNYIRQLGAAGCCPVIEMGDWNNEYLDQLKDARFAPDVTGRLDTVQYEDHQPPLYYMIVYAALYALDLTGDVPTDDLTQARFVSVLMGAGVVVCAYMIGRVTFPARRGVALGTAALVALVPQHAAILGSVNNDALAYLLVAITLLVCAHYLSLPRRAPLARWHVIMGVLVGLAFLTKTTAYFLVFIAPLAIALRPLVLVVQSPTGHATGAAVSVMGALKDAPGIPGTTAPPTSKGLARRFARTALDVYAPAIKRGRAAVLRGWAVSLGIALALGTLWWARNWAVYGFPDVLGLTAHDEVVVGQLRTAEQIARAGGFGAYLRGAAQTTFNSFWGQLGWMALPLPGWAYRRILYLLAGALAGLVFAVLRMRALRQKPTARQVAIGVLLAMTGVFALAAFLYYNTQFYQVQGRYLFTALVPFALLVALGLDAWARWLGRLVGREPFAAYLTPLVLAATFGAFNLWFIRFILPALAPA